VSSIIEKSPAAKLELAGRNITRYGLVIILFWIGFLKFYAYEAAGIEPLLVHSPFMAWAHRLLGVRTLAASIGSCEIVIAVVIATRPVLPALSALGSLAAAVMFLTTLSFMISTPGVFQPEGFPFLSGDVGEFLIKDIALLGAALWTAAEAIGAANRFSIPKRK
jgi:uncharacterized membrane protein YkgB